MKRETLLVKDVRFYFDCSSCGKRTVFEKYDFEKDCPFCGAKNKALTAIVVDDDNYEDLTAYHNLKVVGLEIKTRRN